MRIWPKGAARVTFFIAIVRDDGDGGYTASFPDFLECAVNAPTIDGVMAKAKEALLVHLERLLAAGLTIGSPTSPEAIERGDALFLTAIEVPDDLRLVHVDVALPALALARIDSFARRSGLARGALFVQAIDRWAWLETKPSERRSGISDGPTLFDFGNPLELKAESIAAAIGPLGGAATKPGNLREESDITAGADDVTDELVRLLDQDSKPQPIGEAAGRCARPARRQRKFLIWPRLFGILGASPWKVCRGFPKRSCANKELKRLWRTSGNRGLSCRNHFLPFSLPPFRLCYFPAAPPIAVHMPCSAIHPTGSTGDMIQPSNPVA
jgi:predicted RNase H-like HicB family nuclease